MKLNTFPGQIIIILLFLNVSFPAYSQQGLHEPEPLALTEGVHVTNLSWSYDGQYIAVATNTDVIIFDVNLQQIATYTPDRNFILSVDWHPSESKLALTASNTIEILEWDADRENLDLFDVYTYDKQQIWTEWNLDGTLLASVGVLDIEELDYQTGLEIGNIYFRDIETNMFTSTDNTYLLSTGLSLQDKFAWSTASPDEFGGTGHVISMNSPGDLISETGLIAFLIDANIGLHIREIEINSLSGHSFAWQPDSTVFAVGGESGTLLYDWFTGEGLIGLAGNHFDYFALDWTPDGQFLAAEQSIFDTESGERIGTFGGYGNVVDIEWHPQGNLIAIASRDGILAIQSLSQFIEE